LSIILDGTNGITSSNNLTFATGTNGIVFNNSGATTNSTLNDYETGTWTPTDTSGAGLTFASVPFAFYTKVGNMVFASCDITYPSTANGSSAQFSMPFTPTNYANAYAGYTSYTTTAIYFESVTGQSNMTIQNSSFANLTNANLSGKRFIITIVYKATF